MGVLLPGSYDRIVAIVRKRITRDQEEKNKIFVIYQLINGPTIKIAQYKKMKV